MFTLLQLVLIAIACAIAGALAGWLVGRFVGGDQRRNRQLERNLQETRSQLRDYQHEVTGHFTRTAQLLDELTERYREVHNHLAEGANTLVEPRAGRPLMRTIPAAEQIESPGDADDDPHPPLDYAPRTSPDQKGALDESFGLERENPDDADHELARSLGRQHV